MLFQQQYYNLNYIALCRVENALYHYDQNNKSIDNRILDIKY